MRFCQRSFFLLLSIIMLSFYCYSSECNNLKLKGLDNIYVCDVYFFENSAEVFNLSSSRIQNLIELKLRQSGIKIRDNICFEDNQTYVFVEIKSMKVSPTPVYLSLKISESATTNRTGAFTFDNLYDKWTMLLYSDTKEEGRLIMEQLATWVDEFCNEYLKVNPRSFVEKTDL